MSRKEQRPVRVPIRAKKISSARPEAELKVCSQPEGVQRKRRTQSQNQVETVSPEASQHALHELLVHQVELEMQNDELRRAYEALDAAKTRYFDFYDLAPVGYFTLNEKGLTLQVNLTAASMFGIDRSAMLKRPFFCFICKEDQSIYHRLRKDLFTTERPQSCELRAVKKDGGQFWANLTVSLSQNRCGSPEILIVLSDVSGRKQAEEDLRDSEERYRRIVQTSEEGVWTINAESLTDYVNPKMAQMMGYEPEEMLGRPIDDFLDAEGRAMLANLINRRKGGIAEQFEFKYLRKDGSSLWAFVSTNPITDSSGTYVGAAASLTDITKRRLAEDALNASLEFTNSLIGSMQDGLSALDVTGVQTVANPALCRMTGFSHEELVGIGPPFPYWPPEEMKRINAAFQATLNGHFSDFELMFLHKSGERFPVIVSPSAIKDKDGNISSYLATVKDISARKKAEEALRKSEEEFRAIFEQAAVGFAIIDSNTGRFLNVNQRQCDITRLSREQLLATTFMDITHPDDRQTDVRNMHKLRSGAARNLQVEKRYAHADGEVTWVNVTISVIWKPGDVPTRHIAVVEDITARKKVEMALAQTADLLTRTGDLAKIGGWELNLKPQSLFWSLETCRIFEVSFPASPTLEEAISFYAPESQPKIQAAVQEAIKKGTSYDLELRVITATGRSIWARSQGSGVKEGRKVVKLVGTFQDITERKEAENKYLRELKFNETLVDHTSVIIVLLDREGHIVHVNQATVNILGYSREELINRTLWEIGIMIPEEKVRATERLQMLLKGGSNSPRETILKDKKGNDLLFSLSSVSTRTSDGMIDRIIVTGADLTERNQLQREILNISEQEQARIGHNLHDGVGQTMTGVASLMESLEGELKGELRHRATRIRKFIQDAIQEVRSMSHSMSPTAVKNRGLEGALQLLAETIRTNHRTACVCEVDPNIRMEDADKVTHIYRIAQEAANNALRHGRPKNITLSLRRLGSHECVLKIENDGAGFTKQGEYSEGIGVRVMDYRANLIGGTLNIASRPRRGVSVICRFPCPSFSSPED